MIHAMLYRPDSRLVATGGEELVAQWRERPDGILWADYFDNPPESEQRALVENFGLHPLAIQDAQRRRHQPKFEAFGDHVFILLKGLGPDRDEFEFETIQIAIFIGERFLVTRHSGHSPSIDRLREQLQQDPSLFASGPDALALRLSRISVDRYLKKLLSLEPRLEDIEQEIVASPRDEILSDLMGYKTNLRKFRRVLLYHVQVFLEMMKDPPPQVRAERIHEIKDVYENQERANSLATLYYEVATDLIEGYISLASHRLNNIMKILTIVTAIFVPLSFLAGIYGMNFEYMPELKSHTGYFVLLGVMGAIATILLLVFRKKRWL
ncbi:MAG TPA: magnesium/cobalt transporter CorA [Burkholderiales bacterium]|nr:magnesium/cobalt transporter CorA [Burkholderiales bacterium]